LDPRHAAGVVAVALTTPATGAQAVSEAHVNTDQHTVVPDRAQQVSHASFSARCGHDHQLNRCAVLRRRPESLVAYLTVSAAEPPRKQQLPIVTVSVGDVAAQIARCGRRRT